MTFDVYTKLVNSVVEPVLFYCAGIWGNRYQKEIDVVFNKACRYFLGTSKNASNAATRGDMGWVSCNVKLKIETVRLWCRLKQMSGNRIPLKVHKWSLNVNKSWEKSMLSFISEHNLENAMLVERPNKSACILLTRQKLTETENEKWRQKLMSNGSEQNGNKLRTYRTYKTQFETEHYVKLNMSRDQRRILAKFRSCNLPLEIEKGRYTRPKTPVHERLCKYCKAQEIEDETHLLISCDFYDDIRYELFALAGQFDSNFINLLPENKMVFLMQNPNLQFKLASSLQKMIKRRTAALHWLNLRNVAYNFTMNSKYSNNIKTLKQRNTLRVISVLV